MIKLVFTPKESFHYVTEMYGTQSKRLLEEPFNKIVFVAQLKKITLLQATIFCGNKVKDVENYIRYQAAYYMMTKTQNELNIIRENIENIKAQLTRMGGDVAHNERGNINITLQDKLNELKKRENEIVFNFKVKGATVIQSNGISRSWKNRKNYT